MTKHDQAAIAEAFQQVLHDLERPSRVGTITAAKWATAHELASKIADYCERDNPSFNRRLFLTMCGVNP